MSNSEQIQETVRDDGAQERKPWATALNRRTFFKASGASLALASLSACVRKPMEKIVPYVRRPEDLVPGKPLFFATAIPLGGVATGVVVESHTGRPTKVEGNPDHPASLGATDAYSQAAVQILYDPVRSQNVRLRGRDSTWDDFQTGFIAELNNRRGNGGAGIRILTETVTSPTLANQLQQIIQQFPQIQWHQYEPVGRGDANRAGGQLAFGANVDPVYNFENADVIVSLDADFLMARPATLPYVRGYSSRRFAMGGETNLSRMYVIESGMTPTGAKADNRLPLQSSQIDGFARYVATQLGVSGVQAGAQIPENARRFADAMARDLQQRSGRSLIIAGEGQPPAVHALVHAMNQQLGNVGQTVSFVDSVEANPVNQTQSLRDLVSAMEAGQVQMLLILSGNPVYTAPADLQFGDRLQRVPFSAHLSLYYDETSALTTWHLPQAHVFESWGDVRAFNGAVTIQQPLIAPLYQGKSAYEVLAYFTQPGQTGHDIVRQYWQGQAQGQDFNTFWNRALEMGVVPNSAPQPRQVSLTANVGAQAGPATQPAGGWEIVFQPDPSIYDGSLAPSSWLQELPKPITKLTWDNAALMSEASRRQLGVENGSLVTLNYQGRTVQAPVMGVPGHADQSVTVYLGYGRRLAGSPADEIGFNAYALRTSDAPWVGTGLEVRPASGSAQLATTQEHFTLDHRAADILRTVTAEQYRQNPGILDDPHAAGGEGDHGGQGVVERPPSLLPPWEYPGYAWGMSVNQGSCVGCNACVVACQAENNVPTVGKEQVLREREMHWLRIDAYHEGPTPQARETNPTVLFQPMFCQHCETAPCELVCPVTATAHSEEGLNDMAYNRCIGTRYCSQNCPYKVRRFNYLEYNNYFAGPVLKMLPNPDVTVRSRGVMEKCTYCVQRINGARIEAEREGRPIRDGEILTACQAACPADVFVFGNINDPNARVTQLKLDPLTYSVLNHVVGTQPRTTYLTVVRNPNPEIEAI